jgi:hypothetical protein
MWLCADNVPRKRCIDIAIDGLIAQTMIDERFALGYAVGRHDAGDIRARARETEFAEEYGKAMRRIAHCRKAVAELGSLLRDVAGYRQGRVRRLTWPPLAGAVAVRSVG